MKKLEMILNRIYFSIYSLLYFTNRYILGKVIETVIARPLYSISWFRKRLDKNGLDFNTWMNVSDSQLDNPRYGLLNWLVGFLFAYIVTSPFLLLVVILQILIGQSFRNSVSQNVGILVLVVIASTFFLSNRFVWKDDRYLQYYKKFEEEGRKSVILWSLSIFVYGCVFAIVLFYLFRNYID